MLYRLNDFLPAGKHYVQPDVRPSVFQAIQQERKQASKQERRSPPPPRSLPRPPPDDPSVAASQPEGKPA
jgi:hypothetical protein